MDIHYRPDKSILKAPCSYTFQPHLRSLDASANWGPGGIYPVTCLSCLLHAPKTKRPWRKGVVAISPRKVRPL